MSDHRPLARHAHYSLSQLTAVLGSPSARRNVPSPRSAAGGNLSGTAPEPLLDVVDEPVEGCWQFLFWKCEPATPTGCVAVGDPFADTWLTMMLCHVHGGVPYEDTTVASEEDLDRRTAWVRDFWKRLEELVDDVAYISDDEAVAGDFRVQLEPAKVNDSIRKITNLNVRSWQSDRDGGERPAFIGSFYIVNAEARSAAVDVILARLQDRTADLVLSGGNWVRGLVASRYGEVVLTMTDGSKHVLEPEEIVAVRLVD